jgi:predicted Zn-dependent protease
MLERAQRLLDVDPPRADEAIELLEPLALARPAQAAVLEALAFAYAMSGNAEAACETLSRAVTVEPALGASWLALGDRLTAQGLAGAADVAYAQHIRHSTRDPQLLAAATALCENRIPVAEQLLRACLRERPTDVAAIRLFAEVAARLGRYADASNLLARCLELAPGFHAARHNFAIVLHRQGKPAEALAQVQRLLDLDPRNPAYRNLQAALLARIGDYTTSLDVYEGVLARYPDQPRLWMSYGHALKTVGREADSVAAYRRSIQHAPGLGEAYWSLANLKTFRFSEAELAAMGAQTASAALGPEDRFHFEFALGKALEDATDYGASFRHYAEGNRLRRLQIRYDADENSTFVRRSKALFTPEFFSSRAGTGCAAPDPIFIVGLPRSGSTLIEQILASHSAVEGTMELPDILGIARDLGGRTAPGSPSRYPEVLGGLAADALRELGERYLRQTRIQRHSPAPYFIDKMPNNLAHVGLIHLILPRARIIDARRHPLACCFSAFKQHFARGQGFSYDLVDVGRYYRDYVELMAHMDRVLPGRVHRVIYEQMVADTEGEVRRLLDYCGLPFEDACLRFYENSRAVRTASSQQVRQPIYRDAVDQWRHYDDWLGPLRTALGPVLDAYPDAPGA